MQSQNLENLNPIDWLEIRQRLESFATSEPARSNLRELSPVASAAEAERGFAEIREAQIILGTGERPFMESLDLFPGWSQRLRREGVLQTLELRDARRFCLEAVALGEVLRPLSGVWIDGLKRRLMDATAPLSAIDHLMTPSGEIRTDASETLFNLHREKQNQTRTLQNILDRLTKAHDMEPVLQDRFVTTREGRWVIPVKGGMQHAFPGIIHGQSQSKQTVFMEPDEVVPLNNRLRQIDADIDAEIEYLLTQLSTYLRTRLPELGASREVMLEADIRLAQAKLSEVLAANPVQFSESEIDLRDVRHPLLVLKNATVIPNSVRLSKDRRVLLLSGPNAGGKTVLLKSVALASHMARCGLPICADEGSSIPFFKDLHVAVGDAQSVDAHLSTFAAHLKILNAATAARGPSHLLLIDEICGSTDPEEGSALARSFIEAYSGNGVFAVITSHLGPLKVGWAEGCGVINGSLEYSTQSGQPTYQFFMGVPGQSLALETARRVGVSETLVERALAFLSPETKARHEHLREIERMKDDLQELRRRLQEETSQAREAKRRHLELIQKFRLEKDQWLERSVKKAEKKIDDLIEKVNVEQTFRKHERLLEIKRELPDVVKASAPANTQQRGIETAEDFERLYPPGSMVFIPSIGQEGVIQGKVNSKEEVPVLSSSMRLFLPWRELKAPRGITNPTQNIVRRSAGVQVTLQDNERVIDVRGQKTEDALGRIEVQLDAAALGGEDRVKIIHGHGTEALKRAIRSHLSRSVYVRKWRAAGPDLGGDGVTWAELKD